MNKEHFRASAAATVAVLAAAGLTACGSSSQTSSGQAEQPVSGGAFVKAISADPGHLVPMTGVSLAAREMVGYAYEALVYATPDGRFVPWLATKWEQSGKKITYTLHDGITCSDGKPFTAETAANNINYHADPKKATFYHGPQVNEGVTAEAEGNTLTITSETDDPFLLANTGTIEMVCQAGLDDPDSLKNATNGTGLYALSGSTPGSTYTYTKRSGYKWGPNGVTSETKGLPDSLEIRVITDETTAANLLLSGEINAAVVTGADRQRLDAAGLKTVGVRNPVGEMLFNERAERPTSDPLVRQALVTALDRKAIGDVVSDGSAMDSKSLVVKNPLLCVAGGPKWTLPATDPAKAASLLDEAGWKLGEGGKRYKDGEPLTIKFIYDAATATHAPAAELVQQTWNKLGVTTELSANDANAWSEQLFQTFDWDTGFVQIAPGGPVTVSTFFAGATPDKGGNNFMFVDNPEYEALVKQASTASPETTCDLWQQAEAKLIERTDVFPLADNELRTYLSGVRLEQPNFVMPTTIRMLG
ncbi:peptide/nickel transport system substrate-binding protein [Thermocatellispora tengchongensis]|uniref:Peptide/nickel transport system substrate-binding protein n=1 Tax=Thermocatellispora tengchongensis TaxID=1073253 RepID=A0A840PG49_9ACTN|nr:ABC transporter substrate-binding protein [Thermocatellispora tengchongensis]MBB5136923.1 peptide/nickel transport system substrate-binding protein [Thermocatellispora tengchongensis]